MLDATVLAGPHGWLTAMTTDDESEAALARAMASLPDLTQREQEVALLVAHGWSNEAIARELRMRPKTLDNHIRTLYAKLGLLPAPRMHRRVLASRAWFSHTATASFAERGVQVGSPRHAAGTPPRRARSA